jgi:CAAX prenyl protease-like protein
MTSAQSPDTPSNDAGLDEILPYLAPMFAFLALTWLEAYLPDPSWYPPAYLAKVVIVALLLWHFRRTWDDLKPAPRNSAIVLAVMTGLIVFVLWVKLEGWYPALSFLGKRTALDPWTLSSGWVWPFILVRLFGLVLLVPLMEELFWRSFLIRWLINPDFFNVPIGQVTPLAAAITSAVFALSHPEWLPALCTGLIWAWLLWRTKSLSTCVISHAVANSALAIHVLAFGDWKYW